LLSLDISSNGLDVEGTKLLAKALEGNQTMTSLNISSNIMTHQGKKHGDMSGVAALADVIPGMRALTTISINQKDIPAALEEEICQKVRMNKLNIALTSDQSLNELELGGIGFGAEGIALVVQYIRGNGGLTHLNVSSNNLGEVVLAPGWKRQPKGINPLYYQEGAKKGQFHPPPGCGPLGIISLADAIRDNGAMTSLNLASNSFGDEGAKIVAEAIKVNKCVVAVVTVFMFI
jgi:Ran GTPase-activating protein (RanGAP) involved in mRNA processing and transport